jgi:hypothetical protein
MDSTFAAATATTTAYTANPTINDTSPVVVGFETIFLPATGTASAGGTAVFDWGDNAASPPVLRGIAQQLCVNLGGVTAPSSGLMTVNFIWTEGTQ